MASEVRKRKHENEEQTTESAILTDSSNGISVGSIPLTAAAAKKTKLRPLVISLGFELQSSDLFLLMRVVEENQPPYWRYVESEDIPDGDSVHLGSIYGYDVEVQLDAVSMDDLTLHVDPRDLEDSALDTGNGTSVNLRESSVTVDTEFVALKLGLSLGGDGDAARTVSDIKAEYASLTRAIFNEWLPANYTTISTTEIKAYYPTGEWYSIIRFPILASSPPFGFAGYGWSANAAKQITCVPQVTFGSHRSDAIMVLNGLLEATKHSEVRVSMTSALSLANLDSPGSTDDAQSIKLFMFMLRHYTSVMDRASKQKLGAALRHRFAELLDTMSEETQNTIRNIDGVTELLLFAAQKEPDDGIHRYPIDAGTGIVLIEYRLFGDVVGTDNLNYSVNEADSAQHEEKDDSGEDQV